MIDRARAVATLAAEEFDAVVIGGGLTGAGVALDAAARGLSVALVERHDFASGFSSRSSKLIHGEPACERDLMHARAPRLVRPLELVLPDGQQPSAAIVVDDARLVLTLIGEAERRGAVCANRLEAVEVVAREARITGVRLHDHERDGGFTVATAAVVDATGAASTTARRRRTAHILLEADRIPLNGAAVAMAGGGFALPWLGRVLVGPVDGEHRCDSDLPDARPSDDEIRQLLTLSNAHFGTALEGDAVVTATCGLRVARPEIRTTDSGAVLATGSDLASWRLVAKRCVDLVLERDGRVAPCRTHLLELAPEHGPPPPDPVRAHLVARYGVRAIDVRRLAAAEPHGADPIVPGFPDLLAEATYAARFEQARSVGDVLLRRTRVGHLAARDVCAARSEVAVRVARAMARALGWTDRRIESEVVAWRREAQTEGLVPGS